jgi:hypothetical protein
MLDVLGHHPIELSRLVRAHVDLVVDASVGEGDGLPAASKFLPTEVRNDESLNTLSHEGLLDNQDERTG